MADRGTQRVVFQPAASQAMQRGIDQMVAAIRPTLGPIPRLVALDRGFRDKMPEMLTDGGTIARRIVEVQGRDEDMGAMFVRQLVWRVHEKVGDGTATTAVLFQSIYDRGVRYLTSGGSAMRLRQFLIKGARVIRDELDRMSVHLEGKENLARIAESMCSDPPLAKMLGEIFDILGEYGRFETRSGRSRDLRREYVEGMYWKNGVLTRSMITDSAKQRVDLKDAAIFISSVEIADPLELLSMLRQVLQAGIRSLLIISVSMSDEARALLVQAIKDPEKFKAVAVKTPGMTIADQAGAMEDLAVLTGGRFYSRQSGESLARFKVEALGHARRAWADRYYHGIVGGQGDPRALRDHIASLRNSFRRAKDSEIREKLRERIGKLMGGSAVLHVGGESEHEIAARKDLADRTAKSLRSAILEGVLPGGGVALLACRPALLEAMDRSTDPDERAAYRILAEAMAEPIRTILSNAGYDPSEIIAEVNRAGVGHGFDVRSREVVNVTEAGILDSTAVVKTAAIGAAASAALALTTDVLIHRKKPQQSMQP